MDTCAHPRPRGQAKESPVCSRLGEVTSQGAVPPRRANPAMQKLFSSEGDRH